MLIGVLAVTMFVLLFGTIVVIVFLAPAIDRDKQWSEQYCSSCGYDLTGLDDRAVCPECGSVNGRSGLAP